MGYQKYAIGIAVLSVLCLFQNCAEDNGFQSWSASSATTGGTGEKFIAGSILSTDSGLLPYAPSSGFLTTLAAYPAITGFKALVMAPTGYGVSAGGASYASQQEANRVALERCQMQTDNLPCAILAEGNTYKYSHSQFYQQHQNVLESGVRTFNPATIPGLTDHARMNQGNVPGGYLARTNPFLAMAIGANKGAHSAGWSDVSQNEANRRAIEFCEFHHDLPCTLYTSGMNVAFNVTSFSMNKAFVIPWGPRAYDAATVPFVRDSDRAGTNFTQVPSLVAAGTHVVIAMARYGQYYVALGSTLNAALDQTALDNCNAPLIAANTTYRCAIYSRDLNVVMTEQSLRSAVP